MKQFSFFVIVAGALSAMQTVEAFNWAAVVAGKNALDIARALDFVVQLESYEGEALRLYAASSQKAPLLANRSFVTQICSEASHVCEKYKEVPEARDAALELSRIFKTHLKKQALYRATRVSNGGTLTLGDDSTAFVAGAANIGTLANGSLADAPIAIGTGASLGRQITMGNTVGASGIIQQVGASGFSLDGVGESNYAIGQSTTSGEISLGGTAQTGAINIGVDSSDQSINIASNANGIKNVAIGNTVPGTLVTIKADPLAIVAEDISLSGRVTGAGNFVPSESSLYNLGSESQQWSNVYTATLHANELDFMNIAVSGTSALTGPVGIGGAADTANATQAYIYGGANVQNRTGLYNYANLFNVGQPSVESTDAATTRQVMQVVSALVTATIDSSNNNYIQLHAYPIESLAAGTGSSGMYMANFRNVDKSIGNAVAGAFGMLNFYGYGSDAQTVQSIVLGNSLPGGILALASNSSIQNLSDNQQLVIHSALLNDLNVTTTNALVFALISTSTASVENPSDTGILQSFVVG